jgi:CRISPR system Cascade subunit CasA
MYNLLETPWLPVRRRSGQSDKIRPWEITDRINEDPIIALDVPRADFNGSLIQWLIGLLQTVQCPENEREWERLYIDPPSPETLRGWCEPWLDAFQFDGDGPRILQDRDIHDQPDRKSVV